MSFQQELLSRLRAISGVSSAAAVSIVPVSGNGWNDNISIPGSANVQRKLANFNQVSSDYFKTMGTPMLAGRDFSPSDTVTSPPVAIVTESFARQFLDATNPVGTAFSIKRGGGKPDRRFEIVGLVKDAKYTDLREEFSPIVFLNDAQEEQPSPDVQVVLHSDIPLPDVIASVKREIARVNPSIVLKFRIFETMVQEGLLRERLMATLSSFFGFLAASLAMIGLYGVISYMVVRRRNEIGIRVALGAKPSDILGMVLSESARLLVIGLAVGVALAITTANTARALLFGLGPNDPVTLLTALSTLAVVAMAATLLPARRAASLDPIQALRDE
jgi:predicted permease